MEIVGEFLEFFLKFLRSFRRIFLDEFFGGIFWEKYFGGFYGRFFWEDNVGGFFVYVGIDLFVKILG